MSAIVDTSPEVSPALVRAYASGETPRVHPSPLDNQRLVGGDLQRLFGRPVDDQGRQHAFQPPSVHVVGRDREF